MAYDFDFQRYVERKKNPGAARSADGDFGDYAFSGDIRILRRLERVKPVKVMAESSVRFWKAVRKNDMLGQSVEVTRRQFPDIYDLTAECANALDIPMPTVYLINSPLFNAATFGTKDEAYIIINSALASAFDRDQLQFVIGHECGHLQNNHVVYATTVELMKQGVGAYVKWAIVPATLALNSWSRRAEITCDRAGMICCKDETSAINAMLRLAVGSKKLFEQVDLDEYLKQLDGINDGVGRFQELFRSHPYLPKRIEAIRAFGRSNYYRTLIGEDNGAPLDEIDREVESIIQVY